MRLRQLLTASLLYGLSDVLVMGVGAFLLLPLYLRALTPAEFGMYVAVRTNAELIGCLLGLGLLSAAGRLFFDRDAESAPRYLNSILMFLVAATAAAAVLLALGGTSIWSSLSPTTPAEPYAWYALALASAGLIGQLGSLWLRLEGRVVPFVAVQVASAALLAIAVVIALLVLDAGLAGLLTALVIGYLPGALVLSRIGRDLRPVIHGNDIGPSLRYGLPIALGYLSYIILNRFSVLFLQQHVSIEKVALFGFAQQVALIVSLVSQSFGKALQPTIFRADSAEAPILLQRASRVFVVLMFLAAASVTVFARELVLLVGGTRYVPAIPILLIMLVAAFIYSLSLLSNTVIDYHRMPKAQAAVLAIGALCSVGLNLLLVPLFDLNGAALASLAAFAVSTLVSHAVAARASGQWYLKDAALPTILLIVLAVMSGGAEWDMFPLALVLVLKAVLLAAACAVIGWGERQRAFALLASFRRA